MKVLVRKTTTEMAEEVYRRGSGASASQLSELVTEVMKTSGYDPKDDETRKEIGTIFKTIYRRTS